MSKAKNDSFLGFMEEGKLRIPNRDEMDEFIKTLGGEVMITIEEIKSRTEYQNNYYWKLLEKMVESHPFDGHTKEEMHSDLKNHFKVVTTTNLTVDEFSEYLNKIIRFASENGVINLPMID